MKELAEKAAIDYAQQNTCVAASTEGLKLQAAFLAGIRWLLERQIEEAKDVKVS